MSVEEKYRVYIVDTWGDHIGEIPYGNYGSFNTPLNDIGSFNFTLPNQAPEMYRCQPGKAEVKIFRGDRCVWWGVIVRASGDSNSTEFQCLTLEWYLTRRVIGPYPAPDLADDNWQYWDLGHAPALRAGWAPNRDYHVNRYTTTDLHVDYWIVDNTYKPLLYQPEWMGDPDDQMLLLTAWRASNGMFSKNVFWTNPYTRPATVRFVVWVYKVGNSRTLHQKGVQLSLIDIAANKVIKTSTVKFNGKGFPEYKWTRVQVSVTVPADGVEYRIRPALYAPAGDVYVNTGAYYGRAHLTYPVIDEYVNQDQAYICYDLLRKSQDPALGKGPMGFGLNWSGPNVGVRRTRYYYAHERTTLYDAMWEFVSLDNGLDLNVTWNTAGTSRWLNGQARLGVEQTTVLSNETNIADFSLDVDAEALANQIIISENGVEDASGKEGYIRGSTVELTPTKTEGINPRRVLEMAYPSTPGSSWTTLYSQARRGYMRYSRFTRTPTLTMSSAATDSLLSEIGLGDIVTVRLNDGWVKADGRYRVVDVTIDPETDQISYTVSPEDVDA